MFKLSLLTVAILSSVASGGLAQTEPVQPGCEANDLPCDGGDSPLEVSPWLQGKLFWAMQ